jgi:hypothetical protein
LDLIGEFHQQKQKTNPKEAIHKEAEELHGKSSKIQ